MNSPILEESAGVTATEAPVQHEPGARFEPFPLTAVQHAYWMGRSGAFALGGVATHLYWELDAIDIDVARLERAWNRLIERHDMLRAVVLPEGNQRILEHVPRYRIAGTNARLPRASTREVLEQTRAEMSHQLFSLDTWPLFDIRATERGSGMTRLHLSFDCLPLDGWSLQILLHEWEKCYVNPECELPALEIGFRDYVLAESRRAAVAHERAREYWLGRVADMPGAPEIPMACELSAIEAPRFRRREFRLGGGSLARLQAAAARAQVTLSTYLLASYCEVLRRFSRSSRFTINLTLFDRQPVHRQVEQVVGDFTSLMLIVSDPSSAHTFEGRAAALQRQLWENMDHSAFHGLEVIRELGRRLGTERQGVTVPVIFTSAILGSGFEFGALGRLGYGLTQTPQVWLDHQVYEVNGELALVWDCVEELFPAGLMDAMFATYQAWVLAAAGEGPVASFSLPKAQRQLRRATNSTEAVLPSGLLQDCLLEGARHGADRAAVIAADRSVSYAELESFSNRIGRALREAEARPAELVAIVMEKGWEQIAAVLGILKSGAAYLPMEADLPGERIKYLLEDGRVKHVLTTDRVAERLSCLEGVKLYRVDVEERWSWIDDAPLPPAQHQGDLAYVIYTSGSTGRPKGVMMSHRAVLNTVVDVNRRLSLGPADRVLALSALGFDLSVYDIFGVLAAGGALVIPHAAASRDPEVWLDLMRRHGVTLWNTVPALMQMLVDSAEGGAPFEALRCVLLSGDWIPLRLPGQISALTPPARIISLGGATEAAIWSIIYPIESVSSTWVSVPYGKPMSNQTVYVLDAELEERPDWVPGEFYIGGRGLALGYWNDPERTRAAFIVHPRTGERLYRTGDWCRHLPDGNIEFLGRVDQQVKVRGHRIECGEIEAALGLHSAVQECAVVVKKDSTGHPHLVAYVTLRAGDPSSPEASASVTEALQNHLRSKLPSYMVPPNFMFLRELPLSRNGKVDRRALPEPESFALNTKPSRPPEGPMERALLDIVSRELGRARVGVEDNFFELGGDSIHAVRILQIIGRTLGARVSMADLLDDPTVAGLAVAAEESIISELESGGQASIQARKDPA